MPIPSIATFSEYNYLNLLLQHIWSRSVLIIYLWIRDNIFKGMWLPSAHSHTFTFSSGRVRHLVSEVCVWGYFCYIIMLFEITEDNLKINYLYFLIFSEDGTRKTDHCKKNLVKSKSNFRYPKYTGYFNENEPTINNS